MSPSTLAPPPSEWAELPLERADALGALALWRQRYLREPSHAQRLLGPLRAQLQALIDADAGSDFAVALGLLFSELCTEARRHELLRPLAPRLLHWAQQGHGGAQQLGRLRCVQARCLAGQGQHDEALALVEELLPIARRDGDRLAQAYGLYVLGSVALRQGERRAAAEHLQHALQAFKTADYDGPWEQVYASLVVALRGQASEARVQAWIAEGVAAARASRRWAEAANLLLERVDLALAAGQTEEAQVQLEQARALMAHSPGHPLQAGVALAEAHLLKARGHTARAIAHAETALLSLGDEVNPADRIYFCRRLAQWLAESGQTVDAIELLERAHRLELEGARQNRQLDLQALRQRVELCHERSWREHSERHAAELAEANTRLQQTLDELHATQRELLDSAKHAALGRLLAGIAHELNTPLGVALTASSAARQAVDELRGSLSAGSLRRSELERSLDELARAGALVASALERGVGLLGNYRDLQLEVRPAEPVRVELGTLLRQAWQLALPEPHGLSLELQAQGHAWLERDALLEVLRQLLHNVARHAYPRGSGRVELRAGVTQGRLWLSLADQGPGIPAEQLPHVFEPFYSSRFGQGRSGLGLFIARTLVTQRLGGRIGIDCPAGGGCQVRLDLPCAEPL